MRISLTRRAAGILGVIVGPLLLVPGCGSDGGDVRRLGRPASGVRESAPPSKKPPLSAATRAPVDNCYDESYEEHGNPTPEEQLILELINRARQNPGAEAVRLNIQWQVDPDDAGPINIGDVDINENQDGLTLNIQPLPPLAMNGRLLAAARAHCWDMNDRDFFDHTNLDGDDPGDRITAQAYPWSAYAENIAYGQPNPEAHHYAYIVDTGIDDRGHRTNCLDFPSVKEVGIGYIDTGDGATTRFSTEDFGRRALFDAFIVGVVYDDADGDNFYDIGEGIADVEVMPDSGDWHAITSDSGGYAIPITMSGTVEVAFTFPGGFNSVKTINVDDPLERKLDCTFQEAVASGATVTLQQGVDSYSGCIDTHIQKDGYDNDTNDNNGNSADLLVNCEHYVLST